MLNINNQKDIPEMMKYHRTRDMINLLNFFPEISPVRNLTIVKSIEDYKENYEFVKNFPGERNDNPITKSAMKSISGTGINPDITNIFKEVKKEDLDGVMVLFDLINEPSERCERYAGISINVRLGECVSIEAVGKGFDGREVTKGISCHERYYIPWFKLRNCNIGKFKEYRTYIINDEDYKESRNERVEYLIGIGLSKEKVLKDVPVTYTEIPNFIWLDIIKNIIKRLEKLEDELKMANLTDFSISGHTEGKKFMPWQMFDKNRYKI